MISYIQKLIDKVKKSEKGQGMVEYALIIAFVAAIAIFVLNGKLGTSINSAFDSASQEVTAATDTAKEIGKKSNDGLVSPASGETGGSEPTVP